MISAGVGDSGQGTEVGGSVGAEVGDWHAQKLTTLSALESVTRAEDGDSVGDFIRLSDH